MPTFVSPSSCLSSDCSPAPAMPAGRKARRSNLQKLALGGMALAALATSAVAQSASTPLPVTTDDATVTPVTATMDAGLSAVRVGDSTTPDSADHNAITVGAGVRLETTSANVIQVDSGTGNTITNDGTLVANTAGAGVAIASGHDNAIVNTGSITAADAGITATEDTAGTSVTNSGTINAGRGGIALTGGAAAINNTGSITSVDDAIFVGNRAEAAHSTDNGGPIANAGTVVATFGNGIVVAGANAQSGSIRNSGSLSAYMDGIVVEGDNAGAIENAATGSLSATSRAIAVYANNTGTISNAGTIVGKDEEDWGWSVGLSVSSANSGTISNTGSIAVARDGIYVEEGNMATGRIENSGTITSKYDAGISLYGPNAGTIHNTATGSINTQYTSISVSGANAAGATIRNDGTLSTDWGDGVYLRGTNEGSLVNNGTMEVGGSGISIRGRIDSVDVRLMADPPVDGDTPAVPVPANSGTITNNGRIVADEDGIVVTGPSVPRYDFAVTGIGPETPATDMPPTNGSTGIITNAGTIEAGGNGISVGGGGLKAMKMIDTSAPSQANAGTIQNLAGATITADGSGIAVGGENVSTGIVRNAGTITAGDAGILVGSRRVYFRDRDSGVATTITANSGLIENAAGATLAAENFGILVSGANAGTVLNAGTIESASSGIVVEGSSSQPFVDAADPGDEPVEIAEPVAANSGTVRNTGSITTRESSGIRVSGANAGTIENAAGAAIATGYDGIVLRGDNLAAGRMLNGVNASITSFFPALAVIGENAGLMENAGRLSVATLAGLYVGGDNTGTIHNTATGTIDLAARVDSRPVEGAVVTSERDVMLSGAGIQVLGENADGASILNEGTILAASYGISVGWDNAGTIANRGTLGSAAAPLGDTGIYVFGSNTGTVLNSGTITAAGGIVIVGDNAGTVRNETGGVITAENGIVLVGDNAAGATVDNAGSIVASEYGLLLEGSDGDGEILGGNNAGTITNTGSIHAGAIGVLVNGDSALLANSGQITATYGGIAILGDAATTRAGTITTTGEAAVGLLITGDAETVDAAGTITTTGTGIQVGASVTGSLTNSGTILTSGPAADGIRVAGTGLVVNHGRIAASGEGSTAVNLTGEEQTLVNSGALSAGKVAVLSNGDDTVVMAAGASVSGDLVSTSLGSTLYFGATADATPARGILASPSSAFNMTYGGAASNFNTVFLAGTTNFNGTGVTSALNTSAILAPATFRANSRVQFTATGALPTGLALPTSTAADDVALYNMGTLGGTGTVALRSAGGGVGTLVNTGTIAPGNSIGTLTIAGNVHNSGTLAIELDANTSDVLSLTSGVAGATSTFTFAAGSTIAFSGAGAVNATPGAIYNFMTADSTARIVIEGTPTSAHQLLNTTDSLPDYKFFVAGDSVTLGNLTKLYAVVARDHAYEKFATSGSQVSIGSYLDAHRTDARFANLLLSLDFIPTNADLNAALELMSGELYPSLVTLENERIGTLLQGVATNLRPFDTDANPAAAETFARRWYTFAQATVDSGTAEDDKVAAIDISSHSMLVGVGCAIAPKWDIGGFLNVGDGKAENDHPDRADIRSFDLGAFARYDNAGDYYYASLAYSSSSFEVDRQASVARSHPWVTEAAARATGEFDGEQLTAYLEKGFTFKLGNSFLQPYVALQYARGSYDRCIETGAGLLNLTVDGDDFSSLRGILGVAWRYEINRTIGVGLRGTWAHEFEDEVALADAAFTGTTGSFRLRGLEVGADRFTAGLDLNVRLTDKLSAFLRGDYATSDGLESQSANIGIRYNW